MRLICPECGETYAVAKGLIPDEGRDVQCASCNHTWFQKPLEDEDAVQPPKPTRLSDLVQPAAQSDEEERERLRRAVREELALQESDATLAGGLGKPRSAQTAKPVQLEQEEADFMDSLRSHLKEAEKEAKKDKDKGPVKSSRRNVAEAAAMAGVDTSTPTKAEASEGVRQIGQKFDIEELQSDPVFQNQRRGRKRWGFVSACLAASAATIVYLNADAISARYPQSASAIARYTDFVDQSRMQIEDLAGVARDSVASFSSADN